MVTKRIDITGVTRKLFENSECIAKILRTIHFIKCEKTQMTNTSLHFTPL